MRDCELRGYFDKPTVWIEVFVFCASQTLTKLSQYLIVWLGSSQRDMFYVILLYHRDIGRDFF